MKNLKKYIELKSIHTIKVSDDEIHDAEKALKLKFDSEYLLYLKLCGQFEYEYLEFYGLGVPLQSYINVVNAYLELSSSNSYPKSAIPIIDMGDGHYAIYDIVTKNVVEWCADGIVKTLSHGLESYILQALESI